jgi:alkylation response protein AidB-like acyl-CoA dehydrogenase
MDFGLSEEQVLLQETVRRFLAARCPTARVREIMATATAYEAELWNGLAELGIPSISVPEAHGGLGQELLDLAIVAEELGYAATPGPFLASAMATVALARADDAAAQSAWLPKLATGDAIGAIAIGEANEQWGLEGLTTRASGSGLTGNKPLVAGAGVADFILVAAVGDDGPGLYLVDAGAPGLTVNALKTSDMTRPLWSVGLADAPGKRIGGAAAVARAYDAGLVLLAADAYGGARRCFDMTRAYVLEREQFGQRIGSFQAVKHQLADLIADLEPVMSLYWYAAHAFDGLPDKAVRHAALAKAHACDVFDRVARMATELHGGIGFTWEYDLHLWFRRAMFDRAYLGEAIYQRSRAAAASGW